MRLVFGMRRLLRLPAAVVPLAWARPLHLVQRASRGGTSRIPAFAAYAGACPVGSRRSSGGHSEEGEERNRPHRLVPARPDWDDERQDDSAEDEPVDDAVQGELVSHWKSLSPAQVLPEPSERLRCR